MDSPKTFKKPERISFQKEIDQLFKQNDAFISYPLRVIYLKQTPLTGVTVSVLISVPKKRIKHAVKRNRLKRLIREAYRLNKNTLTQAFNEKESGLLIGFLFIGNEDCRWSEVDAAMKKAINIVIFKTSLRGL